MKTSVLLLTLGLASMACSPTWTLPETTKASATHESDPTKYALDARDRTAPRDGKARCTTDDLVAYRGTDLRYASPAVIHPAFAERLARFERVARDVGIEVYGRAPTTLHHGGAYSCRTMPSGRYSEHAFGNALDLEGFTFAPAAKGQPAVRVRVADAWREGGSAQAKRFFTVLLERLDDRDDVFRAIVGPPDPTHRDHLHLDMGPWSYSRYASPATGAGTGTYAGR